MRTISLLTIIFFTLSACTITDTTEESVPDEPTPIPPTRTRRPTNTPPQTGPMATAFALAQQITLVPPTPLGGGAAIIADDDYVGIFKQAWNVVAANYYSDEFNGVDWDAIYDQYLPQAEEVDSPEELWELLEAMIGELDDNHSRFKSPLDITGGGTAAKLYSGVFVYPSIAREDEHALVWCVSPGGAGDKAGIKRGDHILAVDGEPFTRSEGVYDPDELITAWYGTGADTVVLTVLQGPGQEPKDITLDLGFFGGCDFRSYMLVSETPRIGYYRFTSFTQGDTNEDMLAAIQEMESEAPLDGFIIDIRHNTGGSVPLAQDIVKIFTTGLIGTRGSLREGTNRTLLRVRGPVQWNEDTPVVILIDGHSHSAAELFSGGMQFLDRATIIGLSSNGNTEMELNFIISGGGQIFLASEIFMLPDETFLEDVGVTPDIVVPLGDWGLRLTPYDVQLQAAIDFITDLFNR